MFWLGLLLPVSFVPGYTGASIPTQWVVLSCILPFALWRRAPFGLIHRLGLCFLGFALLSAIWATNAYTSALGIWYVLIWGLAFWLGSSLRSLTDLWKGLAIGLSISSIVAIAQSLGHTPVETLDNDAYPGLLFNSTVQGTTIALVLIALATERLWWYMPIPAIGLILAGSRGSFLILGIAAIARYTHWLVVVAALSLTALACTTWLDLADSLRLAIWGQAIRGLSIFGWGPDSFNDVYFIYKGKLFHGEFVHNDYLQLWFEFGIGSLVPISILALALSRTLSPTWPVLVAFAALATFYFPLYAPITAFLGPLLTGHLLRGYDPVWAFGTYRRSIKLSRLEAARSANAIPSRGYLPLVPRDSHTEA